MAATITEIIRSWITFCHKSSVSRIFAKTHGHIRLGVAQSRGLAWQPQSGALGGCRHERDEIDSDLAPGSMTLLQDDAFHGSPYNYYG
jgi:glucose/arabinose dehydrogenase